MSRRSRAGDKKVSQRNWGSFDIYVRTYTRLHTPWTVLTYTFVGIHTTQMYTAWTVLILTFVCISTYTYTYIHRCTLYTAWTVLTYTQLADFGSGGDGRRQDKGQSHRAALAGTMQCFVEL